MTPGWKYGGWKTERKGRGGSRESERGNKRARSPLHCVTKRATGPTKSLSTLMRVPRCVKIPRRRNNIGRSRCFAIRSPPPPPPSAPIRGRIVVRFFFISLFYLPPLFSFISDRLFIGAAVECFFVRDARPSGLKPGM